MRIEIPYLNSRVQVQGSATLHEHLKHEKTYSV